MARRRKNWDGYSRGFTTRRRASLKKAQMVANRNRKRKANFSNTRTARAGGSYKLNPTRGHSKQYNGYLKAQAKKKSAASAARRAKAGRNVKIAAVIGAGALAGYGAHIAAQKGKAGVQRVNNAERAMRVTAIRKANAAAPVAAKRAVATTTAKAKQATVPKAPTTVAKQKPGTRAPKVATAAKAAPRKIAEPAKKPVSAPQNEGIDLKNNAIEWKPGNAPKLVAKAEADKTTATTVKQKPPAPTAPARRVTRAPKSYEGAKVQTPALSKEGRADAKRAGLSEQEMLHLAGKTKVKRSAIAPDEVTFDRTVVNVGIGTKKSAGTNKFQMSGTKLKPKHTGGAKMAIDEFGPGQKELLSDSLNISNAEWRESLKLVRSTRNKY